jgi:hypothetical protein
VLPFLDARPQSFEQTSASTISGSRRVRNLLTIRPLQLKADSKATVDTWTTNTSRASHERTGYFAWLVFHHDRMSNAAPLPL